LVHVYLFCTAVLVVEFSFLDGIVRLGRSCCTVRIWRATRPG